MAAAKTARRDTTSHMHDFYVPNDPLQDSCIGRRTGIPLKIKARKDSNGFENVDDYFPDSDPEEENNDPNELRTEEEVLVGRRTGIPLNIKPRKDSQGFEIVDDYFPDSVFEKSKGSSCESTPQREEEENLPETTCADESMVAETPQRKFESPNDTGTLMKHPASGDPTPQFKGTKKRLSFAQGKTPMVVAQPGEIQSSLAGDKSVIDIDDESDSDINVIDDDTHNQEAIKVLPPTSPQVTSKTAKQEVPKTYQRGASADDDDDDVIDIEIVDNEDTFLTLGNATQNLQRAAAEKAPVFVEDVIADETVVLQGTKHKTMSPEYGSSDSQQEAKKPLVSKQRKSKIPVRTERRATKGKKNKIEQGQDVAIRKEEVNEGKGSRQDDAKSLMGRLQGLSSTTIGQNEVSDKNDQNRQPETDVDVVGEGDDIIGKMQNSKRKSTRGKNEEIKESLNSRPQERESKGYENEEIDVKEKAPVEAQVNETERKGKQRAKRLSGTKSTRKAKKNNSKVTKAKSDMEVPVEDEKLVNMKNGKAEKQSRKRNNVPVSGQQETEEINEGTEKSEQNLEREVAGNETLESDGSRKEHQVKEVKNDKHETEGGLKYNGDEDAEEDDGHENDDEKDERTGRRKRKEGGVVKKMGKWRKEKIKENVATKVEAELSGRKTRAQRKKEVDAKLNKQESKTESRESYNEGVEDSHRGLEDTESTERKTKAPKKKVDVQPSEKDKKGVRRNEGPEDHHLVAAEEVEDAEAGEDVVSEESKLTENDDGTQTSGKEEIGKFGKYDGETLSEVTKYAKDLEGLPTEGSSVLAPKSTDCILNVIEEHNDEQIASGKTVQESVSSISNVSSNASSGSESRKRTRNQRRKRKLLVHKSKVSRSKRARAAALDSQDSATESKIRTDSKNPRLEEEEEAQIHMSKEEESVSEINKANGSELSSIQSALDSGKNEVDNRDNRNESVPEADAVETRTFAEVSSKHEEQTPFVVPSAQVGAALKSILKSGGSTGRKNAVSRKRQIEPNKSHSGGSDADDEGLQSPKRPNRKRLSTVSFAATPFEAPKPSPLVDQFLASGGSSFLSTDKSFTPGSGTSGRSSSRSVSVVSSAEESEMDPEEEVTLTNDDKLAEGTPYQEGHRRSKRTIVPPLQYWKNERIDYERRKSGGFSIKGVIRNPTPTPKTRKKSKVKAPATRKGKNISAVDSSGEDVDNDLEGFEEISNPKATVCNPEENEEVEMDVFHAPGMLNFTNPAGQLATDDDPLVVHKFISQPLFGGGQVILRPGAEKGRQFVRNDTMVFYVIKGNVMVTIHQSSAVLNTGSTFFVPQGNSYKIKNLKQTEAKLMFVQIKG
ncbi:uncharacterized protein LOC141866407 isoform X2 [Acropora palmata]|uniref:uncharacterized protein LOC141866407 isoform X2 n=1 Tax=Acropora palmata TaxID=6131 RepID=UPI003DA18891